MAGTAQISNARTSAAAKAAANVAKDAAVVGGQKLKDGFHGVRLYVQTNPDVIRFVALCAATSLLAGS
eukprot:3607928-Pyramimonas_sp.AAC.1